MWEGKQQEKMEEEDNDQAEGMTKQKGKGVRTNDEDKSTEGEEEGRPEGGDREARMEGSNRENEEVQWDLKNKESIYADSDLDNDER